MNTHTHTHAPWTVLPDSKGLSIWYSDGEIRSQIATLNDFDLCEEHGTTEANARLISAAPDLLDALKDAEFLLRKAGQLAGPMQDSFKRSAEDARASIAKAEGREG